VSCSGISWAICKFAPRSRQITTPAPHHSVFTGRMPFLPPNQQRQSTEAQCTCYAEMFGKLTYRRALEQSGAPAGRSPGSFWRRCISLIGSDASIHVHIPIHRPSYRATAAGRPIKMQPTRTASRTWISGPIRVDPGQ